MSFTSVFPTAQAVYGVAPRVFLAAAAASASVGEAFGVVLRALPLSLAAQAVGAAGEGLLVSVCPLSFGPVGWAAVSASESAAAVVRAFSVEVAAASRASVAEFIALVLVGLGFSPSVRAEASVAEVVGAAVLPLALGIAAVAVPSLAEAVAVAGLPLPFAPVLASRTSLAEALVWYVQAGAVAVAVSSMAALAEGIVSRVLPLALGAAAGASVAVSDYLVCVSLVMAFAVAAGAMVSVADAFTVGLVVVGLSVAASATAALVDRFAWAALPISFGLALASRASLAEAVVSAVRALPFAVAAFGRSSVVEHLSCFVGPRLLAAAAVARAGLADEAVVRPAPLERVPTLMPEGAMALLGYPYQSHLRAQFRPFASYSSWTAQVGYAWFGLGDEARVLELGGSLTVRLVKMWGRWWPVVSVVTDGGTYEWMVSVEAPWAGYMVLVYGGGCLGVWIAGREVSRVCVSIVWGEDGFALGRETAGLAVSSVRFWSADLWDEAAGLSLGGGASVDPSCELSWEGMDPVAGRWLDSADPTRYAVWEGVRAVYYGQVVYVYGQKL